MNSKKIAALFTVLCAILLVVAFKFVRDTGILRGYPKAEYLTDEEAACRPVYEQLENNEKAIYTALCRGISEHRESIPLPYEVDGDEYSKIYCILEKQEGEFFFLDSVYYTAPKVRDARVAYRDLSNIEEEEGKLRGKVREIAEGAVYSDDYYLAKYINDYIVNNCRYITGEDVEYASTSYGCLVEGKANCEGYAKAFDLLASEMGLQSVLITGVTDTGENHAWNQVKVGTDWYNIDVTWADTDIFGETRQMYFLCDDTTFKKTHTADEELFEPFQCGKEDNNYYVKNDLYADSAEKAAEIILRELKNGNDVIELRFTDEAAYYAFKNKYILTEEVFEIATESGYPFGEEINLSLKENTQEHCMTLNFNAQ